MYSEARKIHVIEQVLKIESEAILIEIQSLIKRNERTFQNAQNNSTAKPSDYAGSISREMGERLLLEIEKSKAQWERDI